MAPPLTVKYHTAPPGAMREVTRNESMDGWLLNPPPWMYRAMVDGPMAAGRWPTVGAECLALGGC